MKTFPARIHRLYPSMSVSKHHPRELGSFCLAVSGASLQMLLPLPGLHMVVTHSLMDCRRSLLSVERLLTPGGHWWVLVSSCSFKGTLQKLHCWSWATTFSPGQKDLFMDYGFLWGQQMRQFLITLVIRQHSACASGTASTRFAVIMVVLQRSPQYSWDMDACVVIIFSCTSTA